MGARGIGHIAYLTGIAPPDVAVVLNVGSAHLGEFGSRARSRRRRVSWCEAFRRPGVAVLNADDPAVAAMAGRTQGRVVRVGRSPDADVRAEDVRLDRRVRARFELVSTLPGASGRAAVRLQVHGEHHVANALAAAAVALTLGLSVAETADALSEAATTSRWRMEVLERADGVTVVNDAYNANPESMRAALEALVAMARGASDLGRARRDARAGRDVGRGARGGRPGRRWRSASPGWSSSARVRGPSTTRRFRRGRPLPRPDEAALLVPDIDAAYALLQGELRRATSCW